MKLNISDIGKADIFQNIFQNIKSITDSITLMFNEEGIYLQTMDSSHVSVVEMKIQSGWFSVYELKKNVQISFSVLLFSKILAIREKTQQVWIETDEDIEPDKLHITFLSANTDIAVPEKGCKMTKEFEIPLMEIETEFLQIPETDYDVELTLEAGKFYQLIHQLQLFGDNMDFNCSEEKIQMLSRSVEGSLMQVLIDIDDISEFAISEGETVKSSFSLRYLGNICAFHKIAKNIQIKMSQAMPMRIVYLLDDTFKLDFYLAPKIQDDDC